MTVTPSTLVATETAPTNKNQLWQPPVFFMHNWQDGFSLETAWRTVITQSRNNKEHRFSLVEKPSRLMQVEGLGFNCREYGLQLLRNNLSRLGDARQPWPLYSDRVTISPKGASSPNVYTVSEDLDLRRYYVGAKVLVASRDNDHPEYVDSFVIRAITAIDVVNKEITLDGDVTETYEGAATTYFSIDHNAAGASPLSTSLPLEVQANDLIVVFVSVLPAAANVTAINSVVWNGPSTINLVQQEEVTFLNAGSSGLTGRLGVWTARNTGAGGSGTITTTFSAGKAASLDLAAYSIQGGLTTSGYIQDSDSAVDVIGAIEISPSDASISIDRSTNNSGDWLGGFAIVVAPAVQANMSFVAPTEFTTLDWQDTDSAFGSYIGATDTDSDITDDPLTVTSRYTYTGGINESHALIGISILPELSTLSDPGHRYMWPLVEMDLSLQHGMRLPTDGYAAADVTLRETAGTSALDRLADPGSIDSSWPVHEEDSGYTFPIFDFFPNWSDARIEYIRPGRQSVIGTSTAFDVYGSRPLAVISATFRHLTRAQVWDLMTFFDSRAGRTYPFWYVSPSHDYEFVSNNGSTQLVVTAVGAEEDWNQYPFVAVRMKDGTYYIRRIDSTTRVGTEDRLTLTSSLTSLTAANIDKVTVCYLCRFGSDSFREEWITDTAQDVNLAIHELDYDLETTDASVSLDDICLGGVGSDGWNGGDPDDIEICDDRCCGSACNTCLDALYELTFQCTCFAQSTGEDCLNPCEGEASQLVSLTIMMDPVSCISNAARWENGDAFVVLDLDGPNWTWDVGTYNCCAGLVIYTACLCANNPSDDCSPNTVITESCSSYVKEVATAYPDCTFRDAVRITCGTCVSGSC